MSQRLAKKKGQDGSRYDTHGLLMKSRIPALVAITGENPRFFINQGLSIDSICFFVYFMYE